MFSICKQNHPATGIEHAVSCYFFNKIERCLIITGANVLKVYKLVPDLEAKTRPERYTGKISAFRSV